MGWVRHVEGGSSGYQAIVNPKCVNNMQQLGSKS